VQLKGRRLTEGGRVVFITADHRMLSSAQEYWPEDAERLGKKLPELAVKEEPAPKIASPAQVLRRHREPTQGMEA
jgi:hypothetical protein